MAKLRLQITMSLDGYAAGPDQEYLAAGLVDEIDVSIAPVVLGGGERLFEGIRGRVARADPDPRR